MDYDIVIIGSGVAGITAGIYTSRANKKTLIIENSVIGGTTATLERIENYPGFINISGMDLIQKMIEQAISTGVMFENHNIKSIDFDNKIIHCSDSEINAKAIIIASGTSYRKLNNTNEDDFLHKGISYCAVCDGSLYKDKNIAIITDGYSAKSAIDYLSNITNKITIIDVQNNYKSNIYPVFSGAKDIQFSGDDKLNQIDFNCGNIHSKINVQGAFIALGKENNLELFKDNIKIKNNYIVSDENMHTNKDGIFVAGDIREKTLRQIITACSDGAIAGTEAVKYIQK